MKKIFVGVLVVILLIPSLSISAFAKAPDTVSIQSLIISPSLSFDGDTANYGVVVRADKSSDSISATIKLWQGSTLLASSTTSGKSQVSLSKSKTVVKGYTYKVTVDVSINGVSQPTKSKSKYH